MNLSTKGNNVKDSDKAIEGKGGIWAQVVKDSVNVWGDRVVTLRLHYPRFIHAEFMTHRMLSKNASSSRAIPVHSQLDSIAGNPAKPIHWGLNEPGMQASNEGHIPLTGEYAEYGEVSYEDGEQLWDVAAISASEFSKIMWQDGKGYHKQIVNRLAEPFSFMNVVTTATDWENFFWLRYHKDAQPEIAELARVVYEAMQESEPQILRFGEWHLPYVDNFRDDTGLLHYCDEDAETLYTLEEAQKISSSCCAQASYRKLDQSLEKAIGLYDRLAGGEPLHASPFEHPCTPYPEDEYRSRLFASRELIKVLTPIYGEEMAKRLADQVMYTGNFRGWTQYRKYMPNENMKKKFENVQIGG